jgi:hypothetical protein
LLEFAPYLSLPDSRLPAPAGVKTGYPASGNFPAEWQVSMSAVPDEPVIVPAGRFQVSRVTLVGVRRIPPSVPFPSRFQVTLWYAPDVKRYVRTEHKAWTGSALTVHEVVELVEFSRAASQ